MKKQLIVMGLSLLALGACKKETEIIEDDLGLAVISGKITADLDLSNDVNAGGAFVRGLNPEAVEGVTVSVTVDTRNWDQTPDPNYNYERRTYTATTDANGEYTLEIPAGERSFNTSLMFSSFNHDQIQFGTNGDGGTRNVQFSGNNRDVTVFAGAKESVDVKFFEGTSTPTNTEVGSYTLKGQLRVNSNTTNDTNNTGGLLTTYENNFPSGIVLSVQISTSNIGGSGFIYKKVNVATDGTFSFDVPTPVDQQSGTGFEIQFPDLEMEYVRFSGGNATTTDELWEHGRFSDTARNNTLDSRNFDYVLK